jgi:hypothetical protein
VIRFLCALLAASAVAGSVGSASARPVNPGGCSFLDGFALFREAVGTDVIGDCRSGQTYSASGDAQQITTEGTLFWSSRTNLVMFHDGSRTWVDGPGGIGSDVVIGGLSDRHVVREPVVTRAALALEMTSLYPEHLGDAWSYVETRRRSTESTGTDGQQSTNPPTSPPEPSGCAAPPLTLRLGSLHTWLRDEESGATVEQSLMAFGGDAALGMRTRAEAYVASCAERTIDVNGEPYTARMRVDPFVDLGDDAFQVVAEYEGQHSGTRRSWRIGYVRYGGLISSVRFWRETRAAPELALAKLRWVAERAHECIQEGAWYLRD